MKDSSNYYLPCAEIISDCTHIEDMHLPAIDTGHRTGGSHGSQSL